jgi:hypothetical protein
MIKHQIQTITNSLMQTLIQFGELRSLYFFPYLNPSFRQFYLSQ